MKILLISPSDFLKKRSDIIKLYISRYSLHGGNVPPLGLGYIAASAINSGHIVKIVDMRIQNLSKTMFKNVVIEFSPDLIGIYLTTFNIKEAVYVAETIKKINTNITTVVGGPGLTVYPVESMNHNCFDFGILGEAELVFGNVVKKLKHGIIPENCGIIYAENNTIKGDFNPNIIDDLNTISYPVRHLFSKDYRYALTSKYPVATMITSRGCSYKCGFCGKIPGHEKLRLQSAEKVLEEFQIIAEQGYNEVILFDDVFTIDKTRVNQICEGLINLNLSLRWAARTRVDSLTEPMLKIMKRAGAVRLYIGVESGSDEILKKMNKKITTNLVKKNILLAKKHGFEIVTYFIIGYPGETYKTMNETIDFMKKIPSDLCSINLFQPIPGSPVLNQMIKNEMPDLWIDFIRLKSNKMPEYHGTLNRKDVEVFYKKAYREFYLRPGSIMNLLKLANSFNRKKDFSVTFLSMLYSILFKKRVRIKS